MQTETKPTVDIWLCRGYLFLMLALLPLAVHNGFFDITETKTLCFTVPTVVFVLARLGFTLYRENGLPRRKLTGAAWAALGFCLVCFIASVSGGDFAGSFLGERGRYQGLGMMWLYAALFFALSGVHLERRDILLPLCLGLFLSGGLAVCNHLGWDALGFCTPLRETDRGRYISTLGNINFAGAYLTLALPVAAGAMLTEERAGIRALLAAVCVTGLWAAMAVRSECAVLGVGAALAALPLLTKKSPDALRRYPLLLTGTALSLLAYRAVVYDFGERLSSLGRYLSEPAVTLPLAGVGLAAYALLRRRSERTLERVRRVYAGVLLAALAAGAALLVLFNTAWSAVPLGGMEEWLRFSDAWGTDRGGIWKYCLSLYGEFPFWQKLVGGGCGVLAALDVQHRHFPDAILDAAHCEYLQILLNWGLLGLGTYLAWLVLALRRALRRGGSFALPLAAGLIGYSVQAAVNIAQVPGISLFFVLFAAAHGQIDAEELTCG